MIGVCYKNHTKHKILRVVKMWRSLMLQRVARTTALGPLSRTFGDVTENLMFIGPASL